MVKYCNKTKDIIKTEDKGKHECACFLIVSQKGPGKRQKPSE